MMEDMKPATGPDMSKKAPTMPQETWSKFAEGPLLRSEVELLKARVAGGKTAMVAVAVTVKRLTAERDTALAENARLREALERLASNEAFIVPRSTTEEEKARMFFAEAALEAKHD